MFNTIIIGGGPAALLAALRLHRSNSISPVLYEIHREPSTLGGASSELGDAIREMIQKTETVKFYPIYKLPAGGLGSRIAASSLGMLLTLCHLMLAKEFQWL
ncbi:hypothetical protein Cpir12675_002569 [Ceratocystis pirilliformis]|uniref:Uncharacterized protein n=1 Tax=Ceratocystis pirilliformis TaxID=259994 RepID=A0ABR3Z8T8_9PEZI